MGGCGDHPQRQKDDPSVLQDKVLAGIGAKYGKSGAQVALRWQFQRGVIVIPKSVTPARIAQNLDIFNFELDKEDVAAIAGVNRDWRGCVPLLEVDGKWIQRDAKHKHYPFNDELPTVPMVKLSCGRSMPMVGLGTWKSKPGEVKAS